MAAQKKSETGLKKETAGALAVLFSPTIVISVVLFLIEKDAYVRFYVVQSVFLFVIVVILSMLTAVTIFLPGLLWIVWFIIWLMMVYKAWQGEEWEVPFLGKYARKFLKKA